MRPSKLPIQSAPVERHITGAAISNESSGVDASFWGLVAKGLATAVPAIIDAVTG